MSVSQPTEKNKITEIPYNSGPVSGRVASTGVVLNFQLEQRQGLRRSNDQTEIGRRTRYYMNRQDDLATESQKLAAYNMMVILTQGSMGETNAGLTGLPIHDEENQKPDYESVLPEVQEEMDAENPDDSNIPSKF